MTPEAQGREKPSVVFVSGNFNIIHPGHIRLLNFAASLGDSLVVALYPDSPSTYVPAHLRMAAMQSMNMVTRCFLMETGLAEVLRTLRPDIVIKGKEFENTRNEEELVSEWGGRLLFCTDELRLSSAYLIHAHLQRSSSQIEIPQEYMERYGITLTGLKSILLKMSHLRVCIIGDLIVDEYIECLPIGMSREDPTIVVSPLGKTRYVGGAGIVAGHARMLGAHVDFFTVTGNDDIAEYALGSLEEAGVSLYPVRDPNRPTTLKQRFKAQGKTLMRLNTLSSQRIDKEAQDRILEKLLLLLSDSDLLIFSDFSYGALPTPLVDAVTRACMEHNVLIAGDSQTSSQVGDISRFKNAALLTPTELEARHALRNFEQGLAATATELLLTTSAKHVIITLGENGCLIHRQVERHPAMHTDRLPALSSFAVDTAGAGDSLLTSAALALAVGANIWEAALLGSLAAAVQVSRAGNIPLTSKEILDVLGNCQSAPNVP